MAQCGLGSGVGVKELPSECYHPSDGPPRDKLLKRAKEVGRSRIEPLLMKSAGKQAVSELNSHLIRLQSWQQTLSLKRLASPAPSHVLKT